MVDTDVVVVMLLEKDSHAGGRSVNLCITVTMTMHLAWRSRSRRTFDNRGPGLDRDSLQQLLPTGGARNAIDCALWDLRSQTLWSQCVADRWPGTAAQIANSHVHRRRKAIREKWRLMHALYAQARAIKIKLTGEAHDAETCSRALVRVAQPDVWLGVDANRGSRHRCCAS
jgi:L-alanine-DL-glutamate epimerase-like enolase superfamily enzyme